MSSSKQSLVFTVDNVPVGNLATEDNQVENLDPGDLILTVNDLIVSERDPKNLTPADLTLITYEAVRAQVGHDFDIAAIAAIVIPSCFLKGDSVLFTRIFLWAQDRDIPVYTEDSVQQVA